MASLIVCYAAILKTTNMELGVDPSKIITFYLERRVKRKTELCDYFDTISIDALELAKTWDEFVSRLSVASFSIDKNKYWWDDPLIRKLEKLGVGYQNSMAYPKLVEFYEMLPIINNKSKSRWASEFNDTFYDHLGKLIHQRKITKDICEKVISQVTNQFYISSEVNDANFKSLSNSVVALYKEAAALSVLAKTIRTTIK